MTRYQQVRVGDVVEYDDADCVVEAVSIERDRPTSLHLRSRDGVRYNVLASAIADSVAVVDRSATETRSQPLQLDGVADDARESALELVAHMREIETGYRSCNSAEALPGEPKAQFDPATTDLSSRVDAKAKELSKSLRTVWKYWSAYSANGAFGLLDKRQARSSNPLAGVDHRLVDAIKAVAARETDDSTGTYNRFRRRVERHLASLYGNDQVKLPKSATTFNMYVRAVTGGQYTTGNATTRRTTAAQPNRSFSLMAATRPGEAVMMDSTRLDVLAFDPDTGASHAVELTFALDLCTRSLLSWRLTPVGTKAVDAALMLADTLTPEPMRPGWPDAVRYRVLQIPFERVVSVDERIENAAARPVILPETIVIDHGKIYVSQAFRDACQRLGISLQLARKGQGTDKANVERLFGTVRTQFSEHIAGYKGPNVSQRGADIEGRARWTIGELEEFLAEYIICIYQRRAHAGLVLPGWPELAMSPNDAYNEAVERTGVIQIPPNRELYFELMPTVWSTIRHDGVRVNGLQYRSEALFRYRGTKSGYAAEKGKWPIKYDPRDRNQVFFQDPDDGVWHPVAWIHRYDDTRPFTDRTLDFVKRTLVERGMRPNDEELIADALAALQNRMDTPLELVGKERQRAIRDAERARTAARDRRNAGMPDTGLRAVPERPDLDVDEPDDFELGDLDGFGVFDPKAGLGR